MPKVGANKNGMANRWMATQPTRSVWDEESLRGRAKDLGYWIVKIIAHRNDYWYLVKAHSPKEPIFAGKKGKDFINLGPLGSPDAVMAAIGVLESQREDQEEDVV